MKTRNRRSAGFGMTVLAFATAVCGVPASAAGQLTPDRLYYGVNRAVPMHVAVPADSEGPARVHLLKAGTAATIETAEVSPGEVNIAEVFPTLWETREVVFAQLVIGQKKVGPAVVLQPLLTPRTAQMQRQIDPSTGRPTGGMSVVFPEAPSEAIVLSGLRAYVDKDVVLETTAGEIRVRLRPDVAPNTAWNYRELVEGGFYTDIDVHRIMPQFVIQGGDPTAQGNGGPGYFVDLEPSTLKHEFGVISMARSGDPNSNGSQFFICVDREHVKHLDGLYTSFAEAVSGAEVIEKLANTPLQPGTDRPQEMPSIISAHLVDAPPYGDGPPAVTRPAPEPTGR